MEWTPPPGSDGPGAARRSPEVTSRPEAPPALPSPSTPPKSRHVLPGSGAGRRGHLRQRDAADRFHRDPIGFLISDGSDDATRQRLASQCVNRLSILTPDLEWAPGVGRVDSVAVTVALAVNDQGRREVLDMAIGPSEAETFWTEFLRSLARRGLQRRAVGDLRRPQRSQGRSDPGARRHLAKMPRGAVEKGLVL